MVAVEREARRDGLHPDLRRDYRRTLIGSLLVFALPGAIVLGVIAMRHHATRQELLRSAVDAFAGAMLLLAGLLLVRSAFWYRRCSAVFYTRNAAPMRVHALTNERGGLFLELHPLSDPRLREAQVRIQVQPPTWDASGLDGQLVKVRLDEDPAGPVVVEAEGGVLWPAPLSRRENRVEGRLA